MRIATEVVVGLRTALEQLELYTSYSCCHLNMDFFILPFKM